MLTPKAQWIHRRQSSFCSVTITWRSGCHRVRQGHSGRAHCVGGEWVCGRLDRQKLFCAQNGVHCAHLLEGLRLTNGKRSLSPSPNLCFAVQIYRYGYNADLWYSGSSCPVLLKQKLLYYTWKHGHREIKQPERLAWEGECELHLKLKTHGKQNTSD